jgi:dTDP-4-dehydrorhamnose reductase
MMSSRKRLLVTGCGGQVVCSLLERAAHSADIDVIAVGRPKLDLAAPDTLRYAIESLTPDVIVSAAAYTAVDKAEGDEKLAGVINGEAPGTLAEVAEGMKIPIIHISTDYVFDGNKRSAYLETDAVGPANVYGRTKLAGERAVALATDNHIILRTAWVHSPFGNNFLKTMLRVAENRSQINVVADQFGTPTSALDIADAIVALARNVTADKAPALRGIFNLTNSGRASWADFAEEIFRVSKRLDGPFATVDRISSKDYPTPAKRPANSQLDCSKLVSAHGVALSKWEHSVDVVIARLLQFK